MKVYLSLFFVLSLLSCKQEVEDIQLLNGYWEIEKVVFQNGESKEYTVNEAIDHFTLEENFEGYRVKVKPLLDGTVEVITDGETIKVIQENDIWQIQYTTPFSNWTETIKKLNQDHLELLNEEKRTYIYKRHSATEQP